MSTAVRHAVIDASTNRFRPILLTAAAAILAMIPIAPTVFWGPMAYAIMGGLGRDRVDVGLSSGTLRRWFRIREIAPGTADNLGAAPERSGI